jgi:predicted transcriptional regulator
MEGDNVEKLCDLLFELSNEDRLNILHVLETENLKLSHISKRLDFTVQETSRNMMRLSENGLVTREPEGSFKITAIGRYALELLSGYKFLSVHTDFLQSHTLDRLPKEFFARIGDLAECTYTGDAMITFYDAEKMMQEAEEFLLFISDQHMISALPHMVNAIKRGVKIRSIMPSDQGYPKGYMEQPVVKEAWPVFMEAQKAGLLEERWLPVVDTPLGISEKMTGRIFFPTMDGVFDYYGLTVVDQRSHKFVEDIFEYYWVRASDRIPDFVMDSLPS